MVEFFNIQYERLASVLTAIQQDAAAIEDILEKEGGVIHKATEGHLRGQKGAYIGMLRLIRYFIDPAMTPQQLVNEIKAGSPVDIQGFQLPEPSIDPDLLKTATHGFTD